MKNLKEIIDIKTKKYEKLIADRHFKDAISWNNCCQLWNKYHGFNRRSLDGKSAYRAFKGDMSEEKLHGVMDIYSINWGDLEDLWLDINTGHVFSSSQNYFNSPIEFSFLDARKNFVQNSLLGSQFVRGKYGYLFKRDLYHSSELITDLQKDQRLKYKGQKILILGAGPTLNERLDSINLAEYDYIWSCTKFFLNDKIKNINLDMFSIGAGIELNDPQLEEYMAKNKETRYAVDAFVQPFKTREELTDFRDKFGAHRGFTFHTRYFSRLGAGPRLLALAACLEAAEVSFLGVDGHPIGYAHSFEKDKIYKTKEKDGYDEAPTREGALDTYRRQFCILWDYLISFSDTEFINLGQGHSGNQSTDIFK